MKNTVKKYTWIIVLIGFSLLLIKDIIDDSIEKPDTDTPKIVYSESYEESIRESVIKELYGSREQYANNITGDRADYLDKEATAASGEIVIDEERMAQVYEDALKEFDSQIDYEKVNSIVKERQEQLISERRYEDEYKAERSMTGKQRLWNRSKRYILITDIVIVLAFGLYSMRKKKS